MAAGADLSQWLRGVGKFARVAMVRDAGLRPAPHHEGLWVLANPHRPHPEEARRAVSKDGRKAPIFPQRPARGWKVCACGPWFETRRSRDAPHHEGMWWTSYSSTW